MIKTEYLLLCWVLALIIFIFFCIYRFKICKQKNNKNNNNNLNNNNNNNNKFVNVSPEKKNSNNVIQYINNINKKDKIIDIIQCENIYDDNIAVGELGYNNCTSANADYFKLSLDSAKSYGNKRTLAEICPVSTNSKKYNICMDQLLDKFNTNANIVNNINTDMTNIINSRISYRADALDNIEIAIKPYLYNNEQKEFNKNMILGEPENPTSDQIANNAYNYYQNKYGYGISKSIFNNIEKSINNVSSYNNSDNVDNVNKYNNSIPKLYNEKFEQVVHNNINSYIEKYFFGIYKPIKGQFIAFNNLTVSLTYEIVKEQYNKISTEVSDTKEVSVSDTTQPKIILLTIKDNNTNMHIIFNVNEINYYMNNKNIIKLEITESNIKNKNSSVSNVLQQLLTILGSRTPGRFLLSLSEFTSTEKVTRQTYKLLNSDMHTIMILEKQ